MDSTTTRIITRVSSILAKSDDVLKTNENFGIGADWVDKGAYAAFRSQALACLSDILGTGHPYTLAIDTPTIVAYTTPDSVKVITGVLASFKEDLENGYIQTVKELVHAEVFTDFIEMSESLLNAGYKDSAAVIIGSVLENHLRQMATKNGISCTSVDKRGESYTKKASSLNDELAKAGVYLPTNQKQVLAWLGIRNDAAHGCYEHYTKDQVMLMVQGVTGFLAQFPA